MKLRTIFVRRCGGVTRLCEIARERTSRGRGQKMRVHSERWKKRALIIAKCWRRCFCFMCFCSMPVCVYVFRVCGDVFVSVSMYTMAACMNARVFTYVYVFKNSCTYVHMS